VSALEPGLYRATVRGNPGPESIVMVGNDITYSLEPNGEARQCYVIEDARPLIVIDTNPISAQAIALILRSNGYAGVARQIESQSKPARIPEPGLWGVVKAASFYESTRLPYLHEDIAPGEAVWSSVNGRIAWADLIDPTLIREGVES